jgi:hypothetical protein
LPLNWTSLRDNPLTPEQEGRRAAIDTRSPTLAGLYARAVLLEKSCDDPADMLLLSHCVREILNRLPDVLGGSFVSFQTERDAAIRSLSEAWDAESLLIDNAILELGLDEGSRLAVSIPRTVFEYVHRIVQAEAAGRGSSRSRARFLASYPDTSDIPSREKDIAADLIFGARDFFVRRAHAGETERVPPPTSVVAERMRLVERTIDSCFKPFWQLHDDVKEIVALANRKSTALGEGLISVDESMSRTGEGE